MKDPRVQALAKQLVRYSTALKPGERVFIEVHGYEPELIAALVDETYAAGAEPLVSVQDATVQRAVLMGASERLLQTMAELDGARMRACQAYIGVRAGRNSFETSDVPEEKLRLYAKHYQKPVHGDIRIGGTKWVVLRYPTPSMAQQAGMSIAAFEDFYFNVCNFDYARMSDAMDALVSRMERADRVHITGAGTDLRFSVKGLPAVKCDGRMNIPDGEVFTAPIRDSVEGVIAINTPCLYQGTVYENIRLRFERGRVVEVSASDAARVNAILDTDEGARFVGEFSLGVNPYITRPMKDTLFDEKIAGSFHFTPGACYDECDNGNRSAIHWDMVVIQTPEYGGGEIWFDDELIRKDGLFVPEELRGLNPEGLVAG